MNDLAGYEAVMVMDDDFVIDATGLSRLFEMRPELDLWALQPALRRNGNMSWDISRVRPTAKLRLQSHADRKRVWDRMKVLHGLDEQDRNQIEFGPVNRPLAAAAASAVRHFPRRVWFRAKMPARRWFR